MKHQHYDFIMAWVERVTIVQGRSLLAQAGSEGAEWFDLPIDWDWSQGYFEYRLKPSDLQEMSNKPYGYVMKFESGVEVFNYREYELEGDKRISSIPLYTAPKELTIQEVGLLTTDPRFSHIESPLLLDFYKACLQKASET